MWLIINFSGSLNKVYIYSGFYWSGVYYVYVFESVGDIEFIDLCIFYVMN